MGNCLGITTKKSKIYKYDSQTLQDKNKTYMENQKQIADIEIENQFYNLPVERNESFVQKNSSVKYFAHSNPQEKDKENNIIKNEEQETKIIMQFNQKTIKLAEAEKTPSLENIPDSNLLNNSTEEAKNLNDQLNLSEYTILSTNCQLDPSNQSSLNLQYITNSILQSRTKRQSLPIPQTNQERFSFKDIDDNCKSQNTLESNQIFNTEYGNYNINIYSENNEKIEDYDQGKLASSKDQQ